MEENEATIKTIMKRTEKFLKKLGKDVVEFDDRTSTPEKHRDRLLHKIEKGYKSGYLTEGQYKQMEKGISRLNLVKI